MSLVLHLDRGERDLSPCNNIVTNYNAIIGKVIDCGNSVGYVNVTDNVSLDIINNMTICAWINSISIANTQGILSKYNTAAQRSYRLQLSSSKLTFYISANGVNTDSGFCNTELLSDKYNHIGITFASGNIAFYLNGAPDGTDILDQTSIHVGTADLQVGVDYNDGTPRNLFKGRMTDVRIYNEVKSADWFKYYYLQTRKKY